MQAHATPQFGSMDIAMSALKYHHRLSSCSEQPCPGEGYQPRECVGFRFVHTPLRANDFDPPAIAKPSAKPSTRCGAYAVSFYTTVNALRKSMKRAQKNYDVDARFGTRIVQVTVKPGDGLSSKASQKHKHFDLHEYDIDHDWANRITGEYPVKEET